MKQYTLYILTNPTKTTLYTGVTSDIQKRLWQHENKAMPGFTARYNVTQLVYYEIFNNPTDANTREKQLKSWSRKKKEQLIISINPNWEFLNHLVFT